MQRNKLILGLPLLSFGLLIAFLGSRLGHDDSILPSALLNQQLPAFALPSLTSPEKMLTQVDLPHEPALLTVWASWCLACQDEQQLLMQIKRAHQTPIFGLNYKDQRPQALAWLQQFGNPFVDSVFDASGDLGIDLGVYGVPETYLLDANGVIRYKWVGGLTDSSWRQELLPRLEALRHG